MSAVIGTQILQHIQQALSGNWRSMVQLASPSTSTHSSTHSSTSHQHDTSESSIGSPSTSEHGTIKSKGSQQDSDEVSETDSVRGGGKSNKNKGGPDPRRTKSKGKKEPMQSATLPKKKKT